MKRTLTNLKSLVVIITLGIILQSCGNQSPIIDGKTPFVVGSIERYDDTHSKYYAISEDSGIWSNNGEGNPMIILPSGLYQINDTITSDFKKKQSLELE